MDALAIDPAMRATFLIHVSDPGAPDGATRVIERTAKPRRFYNCQLQERAAGPLLAKAGRCKSVTSIQSCDFCCSSRWRLP
jgi:hypothetical protein